MNILAPSIAGVTAICMLSSCGSSVTEGPYSPVPKSPAPVFKKQTYIAPAGTTPPPKIKKSKSFEGVESYNFNG